MFSANPPLRCGEASKVEGKLKQDKRVSPSRFHFGYQSAFPLHRVAKVGTFLPCFKTNQRRKERCWVCCLVTWNTEGRDGERKEWEWQLVQVQGLLHELIGGEGHSLGWDAADVVERKASVQSLLDPELVVHVHEGLPQRSVQTMEKWLSLTYWNKDADGLIK